jgi:hypothetical protein
LTRNHEGLVVFLLVLAVVALALSTVGLTIHEAFAQVDRALQQISFPSS